MKAMKTKKVTKFKKATSLILGLALLLGVFQMPFGMNVSAEDTVDTLFTVDATHKDTTTITGDLVQGATFTLTGSGRTYIMTKNSYPVSTLSFDYGYKYSGNAYGEFGVSTSGDIADIADGYSGINKLRFFYRIDTANSSNPTLIISVRWSDGVEKTIGQFNTTQRTGDAYWTANISNFSFVEVDGHWHLAVDGHVCNNVEENFAYSCLDNVFSREHFKNNDQVYLYFGGYNSGTGYFKQLSTTSSDNIWEARAVDSYKFSLNNQKYEYRGQGLNTSDTRLGIVHSQIPTITTGSSAEGSTVDFSGTDGYVQTATGYNLKTTKFTFKMDAGESTTPLYYYLGFTANPSSFQFHSKQVKDGGETIEFRAVSVKNDNYTHGYVNTISTTPYAEPSSSYKTFERLGYWQTHTNDMQISFVQALGADSAYHWYMKTYVGGTEKIVKSDNEDMDVYLRFDSIIDKPVYFRVGSAGTVSGTLKVNCKIATTDTKYHDLSTGDYTVNDTNGVVINKVKYEKDQTVSALGQYDLTYTESNKLYNCLLVLYRQGDVNEDNNLSITDLVVLRKYIEQARELGFIGLKSAYMNEDATIDMNDLIQLRSALISK